MLTSALLLLAQWTIPVESLLPPAPAWSGRTRSLIVASSDPWITPAERDGLRSSPSYDETVAYMRRLDEAAPDLQMISIGRSAEGREIWMMIASRDRAFTPEALRASGKPTVLAHGGIHSGEIDGKDAGLMLLRDMTVGNRKRALLELSNFLFVPILNVDGHERASRYGRINQRGPEVMGWRTNARNLNLNRDFTKLDSEEVRAIVAAIDRWQPDLYLDLHVTDGADYQYDITFGWNRSTGYSPAIVRWLDSVLAPALSRDLAAAGHIPGPLVFPIDWENLEAGLNIGNGAPRYSSGYADVRHLPNVLVENHSLKPYDQRVLGTYVLLESALRTVAGGRASLRGAIEADRRRRMDPLPLAFADPDPNAPPSEMIDFAGIESRTTLSPISGSLRVEYTGKPVRMRLPAFAQQKVTASVPRPRAYWIPAAWEEIARRLQMHGITMERIDGPREVDVTMERLVDPVLAAEAFEGRVPIKTLATKSERRRQRFPAGSWRVSTDQPLGDLAAVLLEPLSPDSFLQWGFLHEILQRTEYSENYVTEPLAERMLANDPRLAEEFRQRLRTDPAFRGSAAARLRFFYERSPFWDERWLLYPIAREP